MTLQKVIKKIGIDESEYAMYGHDKAKLSLSLSKKDPKGHLILVTATNPTPYGEGKTTLNIGLSMALNRLGYSAMSTLREPSLGPVFGLKGGATGGGRSTVEPSDDINLHFTGDFHAITSAHNLLAAMVDNHLYHGNEFGIKEVVWHRVLDMNDRSLRHLSIHQKRYEHETRFDITASSEIMAIVAVSEDYADLKDRLSRIVVAYTNNGDAITAQDLKAVDAMAILLKDALKPNIVLTSEKTPALIHAGPFANIAHGCNSLIASKTALALSEYVVTEAGFGADLGAEKFMNYKMQMSGLHPSVIVLLVSIRALKYQAGLTEDALQYGNIEALEKGLDHLRVHMSHLKAYGVPLILALNHFEQDTEEEIEFLKRALKDENFVVTESFQKGSEGCMDLAKEVVKQSQRQTLMKPLYRKEDSLEDKALHIAQKAYGAKDVVYSEKAREKLKALSKNNYYVCMAKTPSSLTDDPHILNAPKDFSVYVDDIRVSHGAGLVIFLLGSIMTMPGLAKEPKAVFMKMSDEGVVTGVD